MPHALNMVSCPQRSHGILLIGLLYSLVSGTPVAVGQLEFERPPIEYHDRPAHDRVAMMQSRLEAGEIALPADDDRELLRAVLRELKIPESSQLLVFSKTSLQLRKISPARPRALYFNDDTYVGWVQHGDVLEVMSVDPQLGSVFYTMPSRSGEVRRFVRDQGQCLSCHANPRTQGVPGLLVRSVFVEASGQPIFSAGSITSDHRTPLPDRWGGWYVTGRHGTTPHRGNQIGDRGDEPSLSTQGDAECVTELTGLVDTSPYLQDTSDLVAMMVLDHQSQMHNYLTLARYECLSAEHYDGILNRALKRDAAYRSETTQRRIRKVGDKLLKYLLFHDEYMLPSPVAGTSDFATQFQSLGPRDSRGRSLRDLDLQQRMFRYPCSYLIYSDSFRQLPESVRSYVADRLHAVLTGEDSSDEFAHLTAADRKAILEILNETLPDLWHSER